MTDTELSQLVSGLHPLERKILDAFRELTSLSDDDLLAKSGLDEGRLSMAVGWLLAKQVLTATETGAQQTASVTDLGRQYLSEGLPGLRIVEMLKQGERVTVGDLRNRMEAGEVSKAVGALKEKNLIKIGQGGVLELAAGEIENSDLIVEWNSLKNLIAELQNQEVEVTGDRLDKIKVWAGGRGKKGIFDLKEKKKQDFTLTDLGLRLQKVLASEAALGEEAISPTPGTLRYAGSIPTISTAISQLTPEMLKDGSWKEKRFRKYNIALPPPRIGVGRKHPYREFLDRVKVKFLSMGFEEMRGDLVESEFWNMDALYMPQFHPARDIHDGYYLKEPKHSKEFESGEEKRFLESVAAAHFNGGQTGSKGWRYPFDVQRARRLMLRSQGTAVSARTLASGPKIPGKYFSIARCFRYEQVDATHAQDFFQIEGIVLGEEIHFRSLLGLLTLFAREVAQAKEIKFLPAYFPFTEPSVELHVKHPKLGWMELGGAGLFRPEVTLPLGVSVPVIAWGLGLDRMAMVALGIHDIRDLFSRDLDKIRTLRAGTL